METIKIGIFERVTPEEINSGEYEIDQAQKVIDERRDELDWRLSLMFRGRKKIDIRSFVLVTNSSGSKPTFGRPAINEMIREGGTDGFVPTITQVVGGLTAGNFGGEAIGLSSMVVRDAPVQASWHEICHSLGGSHSWDWDSGQEYGGDDVLALIDQRPNVLSFMQLGLHDISSIKIVRGTSIECILAPLETRTEDLIEGTYVALRLEDPETEDVYFLSNRSGEAYCGGADFQIHLEKTMSNFSQRKYTYNHENSLNENYRFELIETKNGLSKVRAIYKNANPTPIPFPINKFPDVNVNQFDSDMTGIWFDPNFEGQGFGIQWIKDRREFVVCNYTFSNKLQNSHQRWYIGQGASHPESTVFEAEIETTVAGRQNISAGTFSLDFIDNKTGKLRYISDSGSRYEFDIIRLTPPIQTTGINKLWYDPNFDKEGIQVFSWDDRMIAFWYTYGPTAPPRPFNPVDPTTAQRWYMYDATKNQQGNYTGTLFKSDSGIFCHPKVAELEIIKQGVEMTFGDNEMTFSELPEHVFVPTF